MCGKGTGGLLVSPSITLFLIYLLIEIQSVLEPGG